MHRRFGHYVLEMLRKLHHVTSLQTPIKIPPPRRRVCPPCKLAKMRNLVRKELSAHKIEKLELIYIDIAGPFVVSIQGNRFLLQIVDSATRRVWSIPLASKDEAIPAIQKWRKREELQTGNKLKAARSDNAGELKKILDQLEKEDGVQNQSTTIASSHQNGAVERDIQTAENSMRAMLKAQNLPLEFWDEAVVADAHIRNLQPRGPVINGKITCPYQAYTGKEPRIDNIRVWGSKAYAYVDPKTRHKDDRHDKLMLRGREGVFMGWSDDTDKHLRMYAPDLGYTVRSSRLSVDESVLGGTVDLRLRDCASGPQGTPIDAPDRKKRGRPRKENTIDGPILPRTAYLESPRQTMIVEIPNKKPLESVPMFDEDEDGNIKQVQHQARLFPTKKTENKTPMQDNPQDMTVIVDEERPSIPTKTIPTIESQDEAIEGVEDTLPQTDPPSMPEAGAEEAIQGSTTKSHVSDAEHLPPPQLATQEDDPMDVDNDEGRYYFRPRPAKRKRDPDDNDSAEREAKIIRSMIAMILADRIQGEYAFAASEVSQDRMRTYGNDLAREIEKAFLVVLTDTREYTEDTAMAAKVVNGITIPRTYKEAINDPVHAAGWREAIQEELRSLIANGTWEDFLLPKGANLVSTKWVFDIKKLVTGETERFKARLVARGFSQQHGVDYTETFAPTVRMDTLRMFLAMVAKEDLECRQYDIKNAFTESQLKEQIFLAPPQGYAVKKGHVLRALRSLYGLKQAGRDWNLLLREFLIKLGFVQSLADPCLFVHKEKQVWILVYVDDIAAAARNKEELSWFYSKLSSRFNAKDLGEINKILGVRITRDRRNRAIYIDQELYLKDVCDSLGITTAKYKIRSTPAANIDSLLAAREDETPINAEQYSRAIGKLMYAMVFTRPDIAFTLGRLSQFMKNPVERHGHALKWLLQYIRSTLKQKLRFGPGGAHSGTMECIPKQIGPVTRLIEKALQGELACSTADHLDGPQRSKSRWLHRVLSQSTSRRLCTPS